MSATAPLDPALYESRAGVPITVVAVGLAIATTCVGLRTYLRAVIIRQFGLDDWAAVLAVILAIGSGTMVATSMCLLIYVLPDSAADNPSRYHLWTWPTSCSTKSN